MHNLAIPELSGGPYCNSNMNTGTKTFAANLTVI